MVQGTVAKESLPPFFLKKKKYYENSIKAAYALTHLGMTVNRTELMTLVQQK